MNSKLNVIEICAGAGGQSLGLERAGFDHELAIELDESAAATLKKNRPSWEVRIGDVADPQVWNPSDFAPSEFQPAVDLFAGGVPCPPFSIAGKQLGSDDERDLFAWAVEQVAVLKPRAVMLENVRGLSMPRFTGYRQHVLDRLAEFGYRAEWRLLNSSDFGVPQLRPRFVLIAMSPDDFQYFHWPTPNNKQVTVGQALKPLMASNGWTGAHEWAKQANKVGPTIVGGSKKHGGADLGPTRAKQAWAELGVDGKGIANATPGHDASFDVGPRLTLEMVARLQGWGTPEFKWEFTGAKTSVYRQIGNAFPPPVAKELGLAIARALNRTGEKRSIETEFTMVDPIYRVLRDASGFLTAPQIMKQAEISIESHQLEAMLTSLGRDFELLRKESSKGLTYKLGSFKAFIGQDEHSRHTFYRDNIQKVS